MTLHHKGTGTSGGQRRLRALRKYNSISQKRSAASVEATGATMGPVTMMRMRRGREGGQGSTRAKGGPFCFLQCGSRQYQLFFLPLVATPYFMVFFLPVEHAEYKLSHMAAILNNISPSGTSVFSFLSLLC